MLDFDIYCCPHCGEKINYKAGTCPECGEVLPVGAYYCPFCGQAVDDDELICPECDEEITQADVENYNQLTPEGKAAQHEAFRQKLVEEQAKREAWLKELEEERRAQQEQDTINKAQDEAIVNEITDFIKSQVSFDCKLDASLSFAYIEIKARILNTGYTVAAKFHKKDKSAALPAFVASLIAVHNIVDK